MTTETAPFPLTATPARRRALAVAAGALAVSLAAQVSVPLPFTPVPMTLQPLAVLLVGGLLGAAGGSQALVLYLALGAIGLPVFTPGGAPGALRLIGPTGGYLLAYPVAAALVGWLATPGRTGRCMLAAVAGLVAIHAGGVAQLEVLGGDLDVALRLGSFPFLAGDVLKIATAGILTARLGPAVRRHL